MHALVEYETSQQAEKAVSNYHSALAKIYIILSCVHYLTIFFCKVEKLNDERNWRKGLRVRTVLRRSVSKALLSLQISYLHSYSA
jgi:La-related protein 7